MRLNPIIHRQSMKLPTIPEGFILLQDTREQRPIFDRQVWSSGVVPEDLTIITTTLHVGDYSIKGFEDKFSIERKQISDFYGYIGREREKTTRKMEQFREIVNAGGWVGLVIEATECDLLTGFIMSKVSPETARQALVSFEVRYGVHIYYSRSREDIARYVLDRAIKWYKIQREVK